MTRVKWLGTTIDIAFHVFTDSRDQGPVLLTHIYLLVGLSVPLWLSCNINNSKQDIFVHFFLKGYDFN